MQVDVLTSDEELGALRPQWREMAAARGNAFITPEWFDAARAGYPDAGDPWVVAVRDSLESLLGLLPLVRDPGPRGAVRFAGSALGDCFHPVASTGADEAVVARAAGEALAHDRRWQRVILDNVPAGAGWLESMTTAGLRLTHIAHRDEVLPAVPLAGRSWEEYLGARSRNLRSQLGRKLRRLEREAPVQFRRANAATLAADLETFFTLHDARWKDRGGTKALSDRARVFHRNFATSAQERGWLRLWLLEVDGEPAAGWYGWSLGGRYAYYLAGFDERYARHSVGQLLLAHTIRDALEEGAQEYDLLLGGEEYKSRFAESSRDVRTVAVTRPWSFARASIQAEAVARRTTDRLPTEARQAVKRRLGAITRRLPSRVER